MDILDLSEFNFFFCLQNGAIFGPFFICPFLIFSGFFIQIKDAHPVLHWLFHISFLKYSLEGSSLAIFGYDRKKMECNEIFCQYVIPKKFLTDVEMVNGDYLNTILALFIIFIIFRVAAFYIMLYKLRHKRQNVTNLGVFFSQMFFIYVYKLLLLIARSRERERGG